MTDDIQTLPDDKRTLQELCWRCNLKWTCYNRKTNTYWSNSAWPSRSSLVRAVKAILVRLSYLTKQNQKLSTLKRKPRNRLSATPAKSQNASHCQKTYRVKRLFMILAMKTRSVIAAVLTYIRWARHAVKSWNSVLLRSKW